MDILDLFLNEKYKKVPRKNFKRVIFGYLRAVERLPNYKGYGITYYRCECKCGNETFIQSQHLTFRPNISCGCYRKKREDVKDAIKKNETK